MQENARQECEADSSAEAVIPERSGRNWDHYTNRIHVCYISIYGNIYIQNPPAPKVLGRDRPDGARKRLQVYLGGGAFFGQNLLFLIGRDARLQKTL